MLTLTSTTRSSSSRRSRSAIARRSAGSALSGAISAAIVVLRVQTIASRPSVIWAAAEMVARAVDTTS